MLAAAGITALAACAAAAPAHAAQLTQTYQCTYPLMGETGLTATFDAAIPDQSDPTSFAITANAEMQDPDAYEVLDLIGVSKISGLARVTSTVIAPNFTLPVQFWMTIPEVTMPAAPPLRFEGLTGKTPPLTFPQAGQVKITVDKLDLNVAAVRADGSPIVLPPVVPVDSDGNPDTFDVPCVLDPPGQYRTLPPFGVTPPRVTGLTGMATGWDAAELSWSTLVDDDDDAVTAYEIHQDGVKVQTVPGTSAAISDLAESTEYRFKVRAVYESGRFSEFSDEVLITTHPDEREPIEAPGEPYLRSINDITSTSVQLYWDPSADDRVAGYELRYDDETVDVGRVTSYKLDFGCGGAPGLVREIAIRAYDDAGQYSEYGPSITIEFPTDSDEPPTRVRGLTGTATGETSIDLSWEPSSDGECGGIAGYQVFQGAKKVAEVTDSSATITGLTKDTAYTFRVRAVDLPGLQYGEFSEEITVATPSDTTVTYGFDIAGVSVLKTLTRGTVPLSGRIDPELVLATGAFSGDLQLDRTRARLQVLGLIPVTADIAFAQSDQVRGTLTGGQLTAQARFKIRLPQLYLFGVLPLTPQDTCQTRSATVAQLSSPDGFDALRGGRLTGRYAISDLTGCGLLEPFLNPLTKGGGNTLDLALTPRAGAV
ncbi:MAG: fibronectin type III domain-containing protein [Solirubrobacteraceae bacterium]|nr:fibronectin type III domain-containing protein [Solirubrobacteraceae bacterium]